MKEQKKVYRANSGHTPLHKRHDEGGIIGWQWGTYITTHPNVILLTVSSLCFKVMMEKRWEEEMWLKYHNTLKCVRALKLPCSYFSGVSWWVWSVVLLWFSYVPQLLEYGGPFTTEEVKDVKTFYGILRVLFSFGTVDFVANTLWPFFSLQITLLLSMACCPHCWLWCASPSTPVPAPPAILYYREWDLTWSWYLCLRDIDAVAHK